MREDNNNPKPNRLAFPIDLLTTIKAIGGVEAISNLREFLINQCVLNLNEEFMDDPAIREEWQSSINLLNDLAASLKRHPNTNLDEDILITVKFLEEKRQELIAEMEVHHE